MKTRFVAALLALGTAAVPAFATDGYGQPMASNQMIASPRTDAGTAQSSSGAPRYSAQVAASSGKTREQVYQELLDAQRGGMIPVNRINYPPSAATIERNRELYEARHAGSVTANAN